MKNKFKKQRLKLAQRQAKENPAFEDKDKDPKELLKKRKRFDLEGPLKGFVICQSGIDFPVAVNRKEVRCIVLCCENVPPPLCPNTGLSTHGDPHVSALLGRNAPEGKAPQAASEALR